MRPRGLIVIAGLMLAGLCPAPSATADPSQLTANELADVLGIHWWVFNVPADTRHGDTVGVQWVSADGPSPVEGNVSVGLEQGDDLVKIFLRYDPDTGQTTIKLARGNRPGGAQSAFGDAPFEGRNEIAIGNGCEVKEGDILIKLQKKVPGETTYTVDSGNTLKPGEVGLKVVVERGMGN